LSRYERVQAGSNSLDERRGGLASSSQCPSLLLKFPPRSWPASSKTFLPNIRRRPFWKTAA
jgi:hypothetical protein